MRPRSVPARLPAQRSVLTKRLVCPSIDRCVGAFACLFGIGFAGEVLGSLRLRFGAPVLNRSRGT
jgi:hypothetical protein